VTEARRAWGDFTAIGKAASIFMDSSAANISRAWARAQVRNFYNKTSFMPAIRVTSPSMRTLSPPANCGPSPAKRGRE
jgi:hypothetical protein